ncbi:DnaJ domain-containing protein [Fusobacterium nucleatum]|uniref:J domain-containing protein n=1 Tax=Fusobacterium nucleatum TaxID=851 RepID=UPI0030CD2155
MEVILIPLLILFFILVAGFGVENTFKILPPLIILGLLIYFLGWIAVKYFWIILPIWFISKLLSNKNKGSSSTYSRTYRKTNGDFFNSSSTNRTTYGGTFNSREEAEEFFRTFFGGGFEQDSTNTGGRTYSEYQRNTYNYYTTDKSKYYTILGVSKNASQDEIRKAYHKLAKEHHPDKFVNSSDSEKKYHENKMKEINDAYENLTK